jgi:hypothetical protein
MEKALMLTATNNVFCGSGTERLNSYYLNVSCFDIATGPYLGILKAFDIVGQEGLHWTCFPFTSQAI